MVWGSAVELTNTMVSWSLAASRILQAPPPPVVQAAVLVDQLPAAATAAKYDTVLVTAATGNLGDPTLGGGGGPTGAGGPLIYIYIYIYIYMCV